MTAIVDILIVSHETLLREEIKDVFPAGVYRAEECPSLEEALARLQKGFFTVLFLDAALMTASGSEKFWSGFQSLQEPPLLIQLGTFSAETALSGPTSQYVFASIPKPLHPDFVRFAAAQAVKVQGLNKQIAGLKLQIADIGLKDPETGLYNQRYLEERLSSEFKRSSRYMFPLSVVFVEVEFSEKKTAGLGLNHDILREIARFLIHFARENDIAIRCNEAKFFIILPDTIKKGALVFAKRLLDVASEKFSLRAANPPAFRLSLGVANYPADGVRNEGNLLDLAERALNSAKKMKGSNFFAFKGIGRDDILSIVTRRKKEP